MKPLSLLPGSFRSLSALLYAAAVPPINGPIGEPGSPTYFFKQSFTTASTGPYNGIFTAAPGPGSYTIEDNSVGAYVGINGLTVLGRPGKEENVGIGINEKIFANQSTTMVAALVRFDNIQGATATPTVYFEVVGGLASDPVRTFYSLQIYKSATATFTSNLSLLSYNTVGVFGFGGVDATCSPVFDYGAFYPLVLIQSYDSISQQGEVIALVKIGSQWFYLGNVTSAESMAPATGFHVSLRANGQNDTGFTVSKIVTGPLSNGLLGSLRAQGYAAGATLTGPSLELLRNYLDAFCPNIPVLVPVPDPIPLGALFDFDSVVLQDSTGEYLLPFGAGIPVGALRDSLGVYIQDSTGQYLVPFGVVAAGLNFSSPNNSGLLALL